MKKQTKNILDKLNADEALTILNTLVGKNKEIAKKAEQVAKEVLSNVDTEEIAESVYFDLDNISVEDVWDSSGSTRYGYIEPCERASEMFEEALEPFLEELRRYKKEMKEFIKKNLEGW